MLIDYLVNIFIIFIASADLQQGNDFLRELDFLDYNIWFNFLGLGLIALATLILAHLLLVRIKKTT